MFIVNFNFNLIYLFRLMERITSYWYFGTVIVFFAIARLLRDAYFKCDVSPLHLVAPSNN